MAWRRFAFVLLLAVALVAPAVAQDEPAEPPSEPAVEEEAVPEPTAAPAPSPTTTAPSGTPTPGPGAILLSDNFDDPAAGVLPRSSPDPDRYTRGYVDGEYRLFSQSDAAPFAVLPGSYDDASVAVDARMVGGAESGAIALYCRLQAGATLGGYRLWVTPVDGEIRLYRIDGGADTPLTDWVLASAFRRGSARNRIEFACAGSVISAMVNGVRVELAADGTYRRGQMMFAAVGTGAVDVRLDNMVVTQRAEEAPPPPGPYEGVWTGSTAGGRENSFTVRNNAVVSLKVNYEIATAGAGRDRDTSCVTTGSRTIGLERPARIENDAFSLTVSYPVRSSYTRTGEPNESVVEGTETFVISGGFTSPGAAQGDIEVTRSGWPGCDGRVAAPWTARRT